MNLALLWLRFEIPKMFFNLAMYYPNISVIRFAYCATAFKFEVWDLYQYHSAECPRDNLFLLLPLGALLLVNIGRFISAVSSLVKPVLYSAFCAAMDRQLSAYVFLGRACLLLSSGYFTPEIMVGHIVLAGSAHSYFTETSEGVARSKFYFYVLALHAVSLAQLYQALEDTPVLFLASVYVHFASLIEQVHTYYAFDADPGLTDFITHFCSCWDFFVLHLVADTMVDDAALWIGSLQLFSMFIIFFFETFGKLTPTAGHMFFAFHSVTVARLCAR